MPQLSVIVPTFNEVGNVTELRDRVAVALHGIDWEMIFVDDDSPDHTAATLREMAQADPRVRCLQRIGRRGLSRAVVEGVLSTSAPIVAVMDADLQHDEQVLPLMLERLDREQLDMVVASRYVAGGSVDGWRADRVEMSRWATRFTKWIVRTELADPMSGYFVMRRSTFEAAVRKLSGEGYKLLIDLLASSPIPPRVAELPYAFRPREAGESKLDSAVIWAFAMLLIDKSVGRWVPARFVVFAAVGSAGVVVHFAVLSLLFKALGVDFAWSQGVATMIAMTSNFALNDAMTYRDRRHHGLRWVGALLTFYAVCGIGIVANVGVATALFDREQAWFVAAAAGALVGTVWNYVASSAVTWRRA